MGKIIKNDKVYSGSVDDATSVNYNNSVSKLNARTTQEALDELADGLKNTSVVDNLLSTSTTLPLSANQGRVLDEKISTLDESLENVKIVSYSNDGSIVFQKYSNGVKRINIGKLTVDTENNSVYQLGVLPEEYRPILSITKMVIASTSGVPCYLSIQPSGEVTIRTYGVINANSQFYINEFYV